VLFSFFFYQGFFINSWLGLFNLIPVRPFDGFNVFKWNKVVFFSLCSGLLFLVAFALNLF
ncbi:MAG: peptidase M50, partial [Minisyncoccales bacterium]